MHAKWTVGRTYCTKTIIHISQNKQGVAATLAYTYVGLTYVNNVVATIVHWYYFMINIMIVAHLSVPCVLQNIGYVVALLSTIQLAVCLNISRLFYQR